MYYARHRVGKGGLVFAPPCLLSQTAKGLTRVQVLRSQDFYILINRLFLGFFKEGGSGKSKKSLADIDIKCSDRKNC